MDSMMIGREIAEEKGKLAKGETLKKLGLNCPFESGQYDLNHCVEVGSFPGRVGLTEENEDGPVRESGAGMGPIAFYYIWYLRVGIWNIMAEGTRLKELQEAQKRLDQVLLTESTKREAVELKMHEKLGTLTTKMQDQFKGKGSQDEQSILGAPPTPFSAESGSPSPHTINSGHKAIVTQDQTGKVELWFQNYSHKFKDLSWGKFLDVVSARFEDLKESKIIMEFNKLKHQGSYEEYVEKFEELKSCMLLFNMDYSEGYFMASFMSGLSEDLQAAINMFQPHSLYQCIELGRNQLQTLEGITKRLKSSVRPLSTQQHQGFRRSDTPNPGLPKPNSTPLKPPTKLLTATEMAARREKGLCYNCDEPYVFGHRCKNRIHYMIMSEQEELTYLQDTPVPKEDSLPPDPGEELMEEGHIFINAISGSEGLTTLRATPLLVRVANGQKLLSDSHAKGFTWNVQGHKFVYTPRVLKTEGYDLILGGDWLKSCIPIELDYKNMTFTVNQQGKKIKIQAVRSQAECQLISGHSLYKIYHSSYRDEIEEIFMDPYFTEVLSAKLVDKDSHPEFQLINGLLRYNGRLVVGNTPELRTSLLSALHNSAYGGHSSTSGKKIVPQRDLPGTNDDGTFTIVSLESLSHRILRRRGHSIPQSLVLWHSEARDLTTWITDSILHRKFPAFDSQRRESVRPGVGSFPGRVGLTEENEDGPVRESGAGMGPIGKWAEASG
ncbi:hypothetical protein C2S52_006313 [Perilla frutescens var. hirtella]|nr:hypothetical protein C2S52_006313 [Perilla frutescens var. hirtella]